MGGTTTAFNADALDHSRDTLAAKENKWFKCLVSKDLLTSMVEEERK